MPYMKAELSRKSPYWLNKYRYYELKYYCLQYPEWKRAYSMSYPKPMNTMANSTRIKQDYKRSVEDLAIYRASLKRNIDLIDRVASMTDAEISDYILMAVTENTPYKTLKLVYGLPCGPDMFYDRCRKFYRLLSQEKGL